MKLASIWRKKSSSPITPESIAAAPDVLTEVVPLPEWGGESLTVGTIPGTVADVMRRLHQKDKSPAQCTAEFVAECVVTADGQHEYSQALADAMAKKAVASPVHELVLMRLLLACRRVNGLGVQAVEVQEKN